jgi:cyanate lyase
MRKDDAGALANDRRVAKGLSWHALAEAIGKPDAWTVAAVLGWHPIGGDDAAALGSLLELNEDAVAALRRQPYRTARAELETDPTVYRFYELLQVYGGAIKELVHEQFGDGIMSAINCNVSVGRRAHPDGDRVVVTIDGKFLPYQW